MTKVLVTGSNGFIGRNLTTALRRREGVQIEEFDSSMNHDDLAAKLPGCRTVFHLAGVNRPQDNTEFQRVNAGLTETLVELLHKTNTNAHIVFASSTQAEIDNEYGRSKRAAEQILTLAQEKYRLPVTIYRLPGVFGKWSRPNYNTVVATFCHNIALGLEISISDPDRELKLVYVDDVVNSFVDHLDQEQSIVPKFQSVTRIHKVTLGDLADRIRSIHESRTTLRMPDMGDGLNQCLLPTYLSFVSDDRWARPAELKSDDRGWLFELIKSPNFGQIFVSRTRPGVIRGNHYHDSKIEKFCLIQGQGVIRFRRVGDEAVVEYPVNDQQIQIVDIPPGYTHSIENVGQTEMIVLFWSNEIFDPETPDTYWEPVVS